MDAAERFLAGLGGGEKFKPAGPELHLVPGPEEAVGRKVPIQLASSGAQEPPKPPAAPPGAPEEGEEPEKKGIESFIRAIQEGMKESIMKVIDLKKIAPEDATSARIKELEEENKVLSRLVARLYAENEQLRTARKTS